MPDLSDDAIRVMDAFNRLTGSWARFAVVYENAEHPADCDEILAALVETFGWMQGLIAGRIAELYGVDIDASPAEDAVLADIQRLRVARTN